MSGAVFAAYPPFLTASSRSDMSVTTSTSLAVSPKIASARRQSVTRADRSTISSAGIPVVFEMAGSAVPKKRYTIKMFLDRCSIFTGAAMDVYSCKRSPISATVRANSDRLHSVA